MASNRWWYYFSLVTLLTAKSFVNIEMNEDGEQLATTDVVYVPCPRCSTYGSHGYSTSRLDFIKDDI
jgi:hypothetical protein